MENEKLIQKLRNIKLSLMRSQSVIDTIFMDCDEPMPLTVCEELDSIMIELGMDEDDLEDDYSRVTKNGA